MSYIIFEGIDGSGKSTQAEMLNEYLVKKNISSILTNEPGSRHLKFNLGNVLRDSKTDIDQLTRECMFQAERNEHFKKVIEPNHKKDVTVVSDRSFISGYAYARASGVDEKFMLFLLDKIVSVHPIFSFFIDLSPEEAFYRRTLRSSVVSYEEKKGNEFFERVRTEFRAIFQKQTGLNSFLGSTHIMNGEKDRNEIHNEIITILKPFISEKMR